MTENFMQSLLHVEKASENKYRGKNLTSFFGRKLGHGSQIAMQAIKAASDTIPAGFRPHSTHYHFIRGAKVGVPLEFTVDRLRDGSTFATRSVRACQEGLLVFHMMASFNKAQYFPVSHQYTMPTVPQPEKLKSFPEAFEDALLKLPEDTRETVRHTGRELMSLPTDQHYVDPSVWFKNSLYLYVTPRVPHEPKLQAWYRMKDAKIDEALAAHYVLIFFCDWGPITAAWLPHPHLAVAGFGVSLNQSIWFHEDFEPGEWLLIDVECPKFKDGQALLVYRFWSQNGRLVASASQEALVSGHMIDSNL